MHQEQDWYIERSAWSLSEEVSCGWGFDVIREIWVSREVLSIKTERTPAGEKKESLDKSSQVFAEK